MDVREHQIVANDLSHHVVEWQPAGAPRGTVMLAHGFLDLAWSWRWFAEQLAAAGWRCLAWDWRGHGETEHVGKGGYYHFADYVLDLSELFASELFEASSPPHLVGHSMGGTISTMFAGLRADRLASLSLIEGIGPPTWPFERTPEKYEAWLRGMSKLKVRREREMPDLDAVLTRMRLQNPHLGDEKGRFLAEKSTRATPSGGRAWRFDRRHRTTSPMPFRVEVFGPFLERLTLPVLYVAGEKGFRVPDEGERLARLPTPPTVHELAGAGHMLHWEQPEALTRLWLDFVRGAEEA